MLRILRTAAIFAFVVVGAGRPVIASPISLYDTFDPTDVLFAKNGGACTGVDSSTDTVSGTVNGACDTLTYAQSLSGFNPTTDALTSAVLSFTFYDNTNDANRETVDISLGPTLVQNNLLIQSGSTQGNASHFTFAVSTYIDANGQLATVLLSRGNNGALNDFYFAESTLTANVERTTSDTLLNGPLGPTTPVPEPASLVLVGTGVCAGVRRLRKSRRSR